MNRTTINRHWAGVPLYPFAGLADDDTVPLEMVSLDLNDEMAAEELVRRDIAPYVAGLNASSVAQIKSTYRYLLSRNDTSWDRIFNSSLLPFASPKDYRRFFLQIWEACFPDEQWQVEDLSQYNVRDNVNEVLRTMSAR